VVIHILHMGRGAPRKGSKIFSVGLTKEPHHLFSRH